MHSIKPLRNKSLYLFLLVLSSSVLAAQSPHQDNDLLIENPSSLVNFPVSMTGEVNSPPVKEQKSPLNSNQDKIISPPHYDTDLQQEEERQHGLANHNYNLAFGNPLAKDSHKESLNKSEKNSSFPQTITQGASEGPVVLLQRFPMDVWERILSELKDFKDILGFSCVGQNAGTLCLKVLQNAPEFKLKWGEGPLPTTLTYYSWNKWFEEALSTVLILYRSKFNMGSIGGEEEGEKCTIGNTDFEKILEYAHRLQTTYQQSTLSSKKCLPVRFLEQVYLDFNKKLYIPGIALFDLKPEHMPFFLGGSNTSHSTHKKNRIEKKYETPHPDTDFFSELMGIGLQGEQGLQEKQLVIFRDYLVNKTPCITNKFSHPYP